MNDDLPPLPEPVEVLDLWGNDCPVYNREQMRAYAIAYARAAVLAERERCARVCDDLEKEWKQLARGRLDSHYNDMQTAAERLAYAIRKGAS